MQYVSVATISWAFFIMSWSLVSIDKSVAALYVAHLNFVLHRSMLVYIEEIDFCLEKFGGKKASEKEEAFAWNDRVIGSC